MDIWQRRASLIILLSFFWLGGCAKSISYEQSIKYSNVDLIDADIQPEKDDIYAKKKRLVVVPPDLNDIELAMQSELDYKMTKSLEKYLRFGGVKIVDRNIERDMVNRLREEIILAEKNGKGKYKGADFSDYAIYGEVTKALYELEHKPASSYTNKKGKTVNISAKDKHTVTLGFVMKVYKIPELTLVYPVTMEKSLTRTINSGESKNNFNVGNLFANASDKIVKKYREKFQNYFSPAGYAVERKQFKDRNIFKMTAGKLVGITPGQKVRIFSQKMNINSLLGTQVSNEYVAEGVVTEMIENKHSWVYVKNSIQAEKIRLGDKMTPVFEQSFFESILN